MRRILDVSNLVEAIENGMIIVASVESKVKACSDITETDSITSEKFIESLQSKNNATSMSVVKLINRVFFP